LKHDKGKLKAKLCAEKEGSERTEGGGAPGGVLDVAQDVLSNYYNYVGKTKILINDNFFVVSSSQLIKSITHNVKDLGGCILRAWA